MRRPRRKLTQPAENRERWLVSYADFITLLFAFFTTLYAISVVDATKAERLVESIHESFGDALFELGTDDPGHVDLRDELPIDETSPRSERVVDDRRLQALGERARALAHGMETEEDLRVRETQDGLVISLADPLFFESGGAVLAGRGRKAMEGVARLIAPLPNHVRVEGHTDDRPIASSRFPSNWHLSSERAVSVVQALERAGVPRYRLSASGFADQRPLVSNGSPEGRRLNRRVDVVVLRAGLSKSGS